MIKAKIVKELLAPAQLDRYPVLKLSPDETTVVLFTDKNEGILLVGDPIFRNITAWQENLFTLFNGKLMIENARQQEGGK